MSPSDEPLPFDERPTLCKLLRNAGPDLHRPRRLRLARLACTAISTGGRPGDSGRSTRSSPQLHRAVIFVLARDAAGEVVAGAALPLCMIAVLVGLKQMTLGRLQFLETRALLPRDPQRTKALNSYLSASLASRRCIFALYASRAAMESSYVGAHRRTRRDLARSVPPRVAGRAHYLWQIMEMPSEARMMGVGGAIARLVMALWYCLRCRRCSSS